MGQDGGVEGVAAEGAGQVCVLRVLRREEEDRVVGHAAHEEGDVGGGTGSVEHEVWLDEVFAVDGEVACLGGQVGHLLGVELAEAFKLRAVRFRGCAVGVVEDSVCEVGFDDRVVVVFRVWFGEVVAAEVALHDCRRVLADCFRGAEEGAHAGCAGALAEDGGAGWVAAEGADVAVNPVEGGDLVAEAVVAAGGGVVHCEEAEGA